MKIAWIAIASLGLANGLSACKSNATASTAPAGSTVSAAAVPVPVTATWRPADKTAEFLGAFRPQE